jgi:YVTN family beta-propeller protein
VPTGSFPFDAAVTPDGTRVYVTNNGSNNVSVLDTATTTVVATVPVGTGPAGVAVTPDGTRVYVNNNQSNNVSVIDTATNTVVATVPVGNGPYYVAITPDGTRAYVTNLNSSDVSVIDTATNTVVATVGGAFFPSDAVATPDGTRVYVASAGIMGVIDTATNTLTTFSGAYSYLALSPDGTRLYGTNGDTYLDVIDTATNTVVATITDPNTYFGPMGVTPDGTRLYAGDSGGSGKMFVIDTATNTVVNSTDYFTFSFPNAIAMIPPAPPTNLAPVAVNDTYGPLAANAPLTVGAPGVLGNDTDADSDPLTAGSLTQPANGTVVLNANGSFTYTPNFGFGGADAFTYKANDGTVDSAPATVNIAAPTGPNTFTISDVSLSEGNGPGTTAATFTVLRNGDTTGTSTVKYKTVNVTAIAGEDYAALPLTTLTFGPNEAAKAVTVNISGDTWFEKTETFKVLLSAPKGATLADGIGIGTIVNDDATASLAVNDLSVPEGAAATTTPATFTVTRSGNTSGPASVKVRTTNGSATVLNNDYVAVPLTPVNFVDGQATATVVVTVNGDNTVEKNETFKLALSAPVGAVIADPAGLGTITNDD